MGIGTSRACPDVADLSPSRPFSVRQVPFCKRLPQRDPCGPPLPPLPRGEALVASHRRFPPLRALPSAPHLGSIREKNSQACCEAENSWL